MLNEDQRKLVEENHDLIFGFAHLYKIDLDEHYDTLAIGLCKSAMVYSPEKGLFSTLAYTVMKHEYLYEIRKNTRRKRTGVTCEYNETTMGDTNTEHTFDFEVPFMKLLTPKEQYIVELKANGYKNKEIADVLGYKQEISISRKLNAIRRKLKEGGYYN